MRLGTRFKTNIDKDLKIVGSVLYTWYIRNRWYLFVESTNECSLPSLIVGGSNKQGGSVIWGKCGNRLK